MLQGIRTFVHWMDGLLHADCTMDKCDDVVQAWNNQCESKAKAAEAKREELGVYKDLLISLAPSIMQLFSKSFGVEPDTSHVQVGRTSCFDGLPKAYPTYPPYAHKGCEPHAERPVVVDREDQGGERKPAAPNPQPAPGPSGPAIEKAFMAFHKTITELSARVSNLEAVMNHRRTATPPAVQPAVPPAVQPTAPAPVPDVPVRPEADAR